MKTTKETFDLKVMETFVYMKFLPFLKLLLHVRAPGYHDEKKT